MCEGPVSGIFVSDLLNLVPKTKAYTDDILLSVNYALEEEVVPVSKRKTHLQNIMAWRSVTRKVCAMQSSSNGHQ